MNKLQDLRAQYQSLKDQATAINTRYPNNKAIPAAEATRLDHLLDEAESVSAQIDVMQNATSRATPDWRNEDGGDVKALRTPKEIRAHYAGISDGQRPEDQPTLVDWVRGVAGMKTTRAVQNSLSIGTDSAGGYVVPTILMPGILEALVPASSLLSAGAGIIPLSEGAKSFVFAAVDTIPTAAWRLESGAIVQSDPVFRSVVAAPKSLSFYIRLSRELLVDAPNMQAALTNAIAQAFAKELDRAGLMGTGTNPEPRGILNTTSVQSITNGANGASLATTRFANFFSAVQTLLQLDSPMPNAMIMSPRTRVGLAALADTTNQPMMVPPMLANVPMYTTSQISNALTVGTSTDCTQAYVGDFTKMVFMMREQMTVQPATELFAATGEIGLFAHIRADVALQYPKAFAVVTGIRP